MAREKEIKLKLVGVSLTGFISKIKELGFKLHSVIRQQDDYFDDSGWSLYHHLAALRIRKVNGQDHSLSFKKVFATPGKRDPFYIEEIEVPAPFTDTSVLHQIFSRLGIRSQRKQFDSAKQLTDFLIKSGFTSEQRMLKTRRIFTKDANEIVIDDVDRVGVIIEIECLESEPLDLVRTLLKDNEWNRDLEGTSYVWLRNVKGFTSHLTNLTRFATQPDWNVLEKERRMYLKILSS